MKKNRAIWLLCILMLSIHLTHGQAGGSGIRFGLIADIQYGDCDTRGTRFYRNSLKKLEDCIDTLNHQQVAFSINLGDITDRNPQDLEPVLQRLKKLKRQLYTTPGNHDYKGVADNKTLYKKLHMPGEYYSFKKGNWRFVMLNTNEVAAYSNVTGTWKEKELSNMMERIRADKAHNGAEYNGGISSAQFSWLKSILQTAQKKGERVLIFSHHPFSCADGLTALNDKEVVSLLSGYSCVKAVIAGHHHTGAFCYEGKIPFIVTEGMIETEHANAFGIIELTDGELILRGYGRTRSYKLAFE
ncbi:metallophosphoesterase [Niabella pedocola]|uniref:Metallophosphoesterase n=1 Tax=Niabella pedocola TaxID=1752077 RepID=A0ABS8PKA7_9BACT|nr:metallophosphoesterase [Niabella pedocola]MCD2421174.1 metallophosphoesterase [Niabella pedocola]